MEDISSAVDEYANIFRATHAQNVSDFFEDLVRTSGVDEDENAATVAEVKELEAGVSKGKTRRTWWRAARIAAIMVAVASGVVGVKIGHVYLALLAPAILLLVLVFMKINPVVGALNEHLSNLGEERDAKAEEAWSQMLPLNSSHRWGTAQRLFEKTLPQFRFDSYFANDRLADLGSSYGLSDELSSGRSVLYVKSGHLVGNPFVVARFLQHWMGQKTYWGELVITWTERQQQQNSQGQWVTVAVQRSEVLRASVTQPFPEYSTHAGIIYGHEAAPNLSFSRSPSSLSGRNEGKASDWKLNRKIKSVERQARKATDSGRGNLTMMANREFEALFNATNRDHEVEFRVLFTALAQQEMVKLLNDQNLGPGDNFSFTKSGMINLIDSAHLDVHDLEDDPNKFVSLELADVRQKFNTFHNQYFWATYFGFSPLLTIPQYQDDRSLSTNSGYSQHPDACFWEHEALANYIGQASFKHASCVTNSILRTSIQNTHDGASVVRVTAHGYRGIEHIEYVPVRGGDGRVHPVPVPWVEYIPVEGESRMLVGAVASRNAEDHAGTQHFRSRWQAALQKHGHDADAAVVRGAMAASLFRT